LKLFLQNWWPVIKLMTELESVDIRPRFKKNKQISSRL